MKNTLSGKKIEVPLNSKGEKKVADDKELSEDRK